MNRAAMTRVFERRHLWRMTTDAYWRATRLLAAAALNRLGAVPLVIGIGNGGRAPAYAIGAETGASVVIVTARHNASNETRLQASGEVSCDMSPLRALGGTEPLPGPFLIVDDICGSGSTLIALMEALRPMAEPGSVICTATLCRNAGAPDGLPNLYVWDVADWVVFPWERVPAGQACSSLPVPVEVRTA
ncbi:phosphoribosyltransferase family protein [Sphaerimonospora sp. CA-214678]|uniref:phosphoribosyltransferase family protein n=1 Tax=Sphaerimonospora sp. CA-214678 TaxID=3240029 RepID=UPI003D919B38